MKSLWRRRSERRVGEWAVTNVKWRKGWRMSRAVYNTMSRAHSPTFPSLHLRHNSFSNPSVALPTSQLSLQPFRCFTYVHSSFYNPSFASPTSQALHLRHLASRPCTPVNKAMSEIWNCNHYFRSIPCNYRLAGIRFWPLYLIACTQMFTLYSSWASGYLWLQQNIETRW